MNLQEFIDLRKDCPMCGTALITKFNSRKQKCKLEDNRFISVFVMKGMSVNDQDYEVGYSFSMEDNSFMVEFYNEWDMRNHASMYMCNLFKKYHANLSAGRPLHRFIRTCGFCFKYEMDSKPIGLDLKTCTFGSIEKDDETFVWSTKTDEGFKFMLLDNYCDPNPYSEVCTWRSEHDYRVENPIPSGKFIVKELPQIPFISKEETGNRLRKLLIFS